MDGRSLRFRSLQPSLIINRSNYAEYIWFAGSLELADKPPKAKEAYPDMVSELFAAFKSHIMMERTLSPVALPELPDRYPVSNSPNAASPLGQSWELWLHLRRRVANRSIAIATCAGPVRMQRGHLPRTRRLPCSMHLSVGRVQNLQVPSHASLSDVGLRKDFTPQQQVLAGQMMQF